MPIHTFQNTIRGRGRGRGRGRAGPPEKEDFKPFGGAGLQLKQPKNWFAPPEPADSVPDAQPKSFKDSVLQLQSKHDIDSARALAEKCALAEEEEAKEATRRRLAAKKRESTEKSCMPGPENQPKRNCVDFIDLCASSSDDEAGPSGESQKPAKPVYRQQLQPLMLAGSNKGAVESRQVRPSKVPGPGPGSKGVAQKQSSGFTGGPNPFLDPPRYIPAGGENAPDLNLYTDETAQVIDTDTVTRHPARACLDTGNAGCTLITRQCAASAGLLDSRGNPRQTITRRVRVQGVVAGASEMVPLIHIVYEIKGKRIVTQAGLTSASIGCDLLISRWEISQFESDGYRFSSR